MKRVDNIFATIVSYDNLFNAAKKVLKHGLKNKVYVELYFHKETELLKLREELLNLNYKPSKYNVFEIFDPKQRTICASHIRDRIVHHAICSQLEPHFEKRFIFDSYACRIGKGSHKALARTQKFVKSNRYYLKLDIQKHFENIDHEVLKSMLNRMFKDKRLLEVLFKIIDHIPKEYQPGKGLPIGNLTSQYFANLYLDSLDHFIKEKMQVKSYLRYMDDMLVFHESKPTLWAIYEEIRQFVENHLKLKLKDKITTLAPTIHGVEFLGFRVYPHLIRLKRSKLVAFVRKIRSYEQKFLNNEISDKDMSIAIQSIISAVEHANTCHLRRKLLFNERRDS